MKAPTASTYQYYVLAKRAAREAVLHARHARKCRKLGLYPSSQLNYDKAHMCIKDARYYWSQVEFFEV